MTLTPQDNVRLSKAERYSFGSRAWILFVAIIVCVVAVILAFRYVVPTSFPHDFAWRDLHCWVHPCRILGSPEFIWERKLSQYSLSDILLPAADYTAVGVSSGNLIVAAQRNGHIELYVRDEAPISLPESNINGRVFHVAVAANGTVLASYDSGLFLWANGATSQRDFTPLFLSGSNNFGLPTAIAVASNGAAAASYGGTVRYWSSPNAIPSEVERPLSVPAFGLDDSLMLDEDRRSSLDVTPRSEEQQYSLRAPVAILSDSRIAVAFPRAIFLSPIPESNLMAEYAAVPILTVPGGNEAVRAITLSSSGSVAIGSSAGIFTRRVDRSESTWQLLEDSAEYPPAIALAVGDDGIVLSTHIDGSVRLWGVSVTTPLSALLAVFSVVLGGVVFFWLRSRESSRPSVDEDTSALPRLESDGPVDDMSRASRSMQSLVMQLSGFVRNPDASGPMTIAVTGEWGSGKSSLLNLLAKNLHDMHCRCIWFNAWYHQNEAHLFAALMESIRSFQPPMSVARPSLSSLLWSYMERVEFHFELFIVHAKRTPLSVLAFFLIFLLFAAGFYWSVTNLSFYMLTTQSNLWTLLTSGVSSVATILMLISRWNPLRAYGISPVSLTKVSENWLRFPRFKDRLSFRYQFGQAFRDVCEALGERPLVIVVDDLDRCKPEQIVEILEAISFLTSSGKCFVFLGMSESQVEHAIGLQFSGIAEEMGRSILAEGNGCGDKELPAQTDAMKNRIAFARSYLDKLINISIRVPTVTEEELAELRERRVQ